VLLAILSMQLRQSDLEAPTAVGAACAGGAGKGEVMTELYRFKTECPRCGKTDEMVLEGRHDNTVPTVSCGDCLFNDVEMVVLKVTPLEGFTRYELKMKGAK
jgi:hypothetical protein